MEPQEKDHAVENAQGHLQSIRELVAKYNASVTNQGGADYKTDAIDEEFHEYPLSVQVREPWHNPGETGARPAEFEVLLTTGGPGLRIIGDLNEYGQPTSVALQIQDWGIPWTSMNLLRDDEATLLEFASHLYFGDGE